MGGNIAAAQKAYARNHPSAPAEPVRGLSGILARVNVPNNADPRLTSPYANYQPSGAMAGSGSGGTGIPATWRYSFAGAPQGAPPFNYSQMGGYPVGVMPQASSGQPPQSAMNTMNLFRNLGVFPYLSGQFSGNGLSQSPYTF